MTRIYTAEEVDCCKHIGRVAAERVTRIGQAELDALCDSHEELRERAERARRASEHGSASDAVQLMLAELDGEPQPEGNE